ncbi:MAG TPA: acyl-CoA dehydrogenase family protein [Actinomycetota bacterium]|nr:acyl-CoA dehydrogenase family protein [Actinomycetota bacterium]
MSASVLKEIANVVPAIRERREEIEGGRRMPLDLIQRLQKTGVFALSVPRAVGGLEGSLTDIMRAIEAVAAADGSAGWCTMIALSSNAASGMMNETGAKEIYADPTAPTAAIAAPSGQAVPIDGGYRVGGRWPFASGITHSEWGWFGVLVMDGEQPRMTPHGPMILHAFIPVRDAEVLDTWYVSGLRGTGSNDVAARDVEVPETHVFSLFDPTGHRPEPLYQLSPPGFFAPQVAAVALGIARAALDEIVEMAPTKTPAMSSAVLADKPVAQVEIARGEAAVQAARAFVYDAADQIWQTLARGEAFTMRQEAALRMAAINAVETVQRVTGTLNTFGGSSSIYSSSPLQRHARDAEAITHHFTVAPHVWEDAGRILLQRPPTMPVF